MRIETAGIATPWATLVPGTFFLFWRGQLPTYGFSVTDGDKPGAAMLYDREKSSGHPWLALRDLPRIVFAFPEASIRPDVASICSPNFRHPLAQRGSSLFLNCQTDSGGPINFNLLTVQMATQEEMEGHAISFERWSVGNKIDNVFQSIFEFPLK